jgi:hypothetical protein
MRLVSRRVAENDATAFAVRGDEVVAARDADALEVLFTESAEVLDHKSGRKFSRAERISGLRALIAGARDPASRHEPLAVLGSSLALFHRILSASGFAGRDSDAAIYRIEELCVTEVDAQQRCAWSELFAVDRLGDAIVRLYERHAEQLPDGRERQRAAAIARSVAAVLGPPDPEPIAPVLAVDVQYADHRALGWGPSRGVVAFVRALRTLRSALAEVDAGAIEVVALRADALAVRRSITGELRDGRRYRRRPVVLWAFDAGGRVAHWEQFDGSQREHALARFEALAALRAPGPVAASAARESVDLA